VLLGPGRGQTHEGGGGEVGDVGHHRHHLVVALGRQGHHVGPERGHHLVDPGVGHRVGVDGRRQHPRGPGEQLGVGPLHPLLLGAGHGVTTDEAGVVDGRHQGALDRPHVGDHRVAVRRVQRGAGEATGFVRL
jgi:hypothetical protein